MTLHNAICDNQETSLTRRMGDTLIEARTIRVKPPWLVSMVLQVHRECGNVTAMQNFVSVEELRRLWSEH